MREMHGAVATSQVGFHPGSTFAHAQLFSCVSLFGDLPQKKCVCPFGFPVTPFKRVPSREHHPQFGRSEAARSARACRASKRSDSRYPNEAFATRDSPLASSCSVASFKCLARWLRHQTWSSRKRVPGLCLPRSLGNGFVNHGIKAILNQAFIHEGGEAPEAKLRC